MAGVAVGVQTHVEINTTYRVVGREEIAHATIETGISGMRRADLREGTPRPGIVARRFSPAIGPIWHLSRAAVLGRLDAPEAPLIPLDQLRRVRGVTAQCLPPSLSPRRLRTKTGVHECDADVPNTFIDSGAREADDPARFSGSMLGQRNSKPPVTVAQTGKNLVNV